MIPSAKETLQKKAARIHCNFPPVGSGRAGEEIHYLYSGKRFNDSDEVLFQQVVIQLGQVSVDNWVVPQLCFVLC